MDRLTVTEFKVLDLVCRLGMTSRQAGAELGISDQTVKNHRGNINRKLNSQSTQFACYLFGRMVGRSANTIRASDV